MMNEKPSRIFGENIEQGALDQFESAMEQDFTVRGALMPDAHQGYSLPIGGVVATDGMALPSWVGYDIGCGMCALPTSYPPEEIRTKAQDIFDAIYAHIPVGFKHNERPADPDGPLPVVTEALDAIWEKKGGLRQLGTLGGGNHFIEIGQDRAGAAWIIIHSGSRGIGHGVATHYMRAASPDGRAREGHYGFRVDSDQGADYITDMGFCLEFALMNRRTILRRVLAVLDSVIGRGVGHWSELINRNHNHAEDSRGMWIHRKGATHAEDGMMGVIPGNMRDGSFIVRGLGDEDALWSSSHGAGRVMSRKQARQELDVGHFQSQMGGITAKADANTLDESPDAYKNIFEVMEMQATLVDVVSHVTPIINIKG